MNLEQQVEAGTQELRRYVEGNGFTWCEEETTVFNVTTALGLLGGTVEAQNGIIQQLEAAAAIQHEAYRALEEERDALKAEIIGKLETIEYLESELAAAQNAAAVNAATADSYKADLLDVAYRLNTSYNGGGTVNILRAIARLQNRAL